MTIVAVKNTLCKSKIIETIESFSGDHKRRITRSGGLAIEDLANLASSVDGSKNKVLYPEHPLKHDVIEYDNLSDTYDFSDASVAHVILAGGAGTRIGSPKALLKLHDLSLLGYKIMSTPNNVPIFVMVSPDIKNDVLKHINELSVCNQVRVFEQFESVRLKPDNSISFIGDKPDFYPTGHGDVGPALKASGLLDEYPNIKYFVVSNVDNIMSGVNPWIVKLHSDSEASVTCLVVDREKDDKGGVIAWENNRLQVIESFRLDDEFVDSAKYHNTNTMILSRNVIETDVNWRWYRVRKVVNGRIVVQYERLLQQYTEEYDTLYVNVPRRLHCPIKDENDLEAAAKRFNVIDHLR